MGIKKNHTKEFEAKVVMAAMREDRTMSELASACGVYPITIGLRKKRVIQGLPRLFEQRGKADKTIFQQALVGELDGTALDLLNGMRRP